MLRVDDSLKFTTIGSGSIDSKRQFGVSTNLAMKTTFQSSSLGRQGLISKPKSPTKGKMLEKNYTRQAHISNFMQGINALPSISVNRPVVKNIKKRENLLLKGQSNELNASFGSDHSSVFKKASEKITGVVSIPSSSDRTGSKDMVKEQQ